MKEAKIIVIANQKGGVGKTTTTLSIFSKVETIISLIASLTEDWTEWKREKYLEKSKNQRISFFAFRNHFTLFSKI